MVSHPSYKILSWSHPSYKIFSRFRRKVPGAFYFLTRNSTVGRPQSFVTRNFNSSQFTGTSYDILKGYFGKKEASGLKIGLLRRIDVLKGFLDKILAVWVKNGTFSKY